MNAKTAIEVVVYSGIVPAILALVAYAALGWLLPENAARRYQAGAAFALAVLVGYTIAAISESITPTQFWEWIPLLGLPAACIAGVCRADGVTAVERGIAWLLVAALAAWLIVPTWDGLAPARPTQVALLASGMFITTVLLEPLAERLPGRGFAFWLMFPAATCAILMMSEISEKFGRLAAIPAAALAGCGVAGLWSKDAIAARSLALPYAVVVGGLAFTGYVYPSPPLTLLLLAPLAPLLLWLWVLGPFSRLTGAKAIAAQATAVLVPLAIIAAVVLMGSGSGDDW